MNNNDFDDLFKRASEKYPLRTDSADWNSVARALDDDPSLIVPPAGLRNKKKRRRLIWLFFIFPLALLGYYRWNNWSSSGTKNMGTKSAPVTDQQKNTQQPGANIKNIVPDLSANPGDRAKKNEHSASKERFVKQPNRQLEIANREIPYAGAKTPGNNGVSSMSVYRNISGSLSTSKKNTYSNGSKWDRKAAHNKETNNPIAYNPVLTTENNSVADKTGIILKMEELQPWDPSTRAWNDQVLQTTPNGIVNAVSNGNTDTAISKPVSKTRKKKQSYFYTGIIVAPDISTIKFQSVKGTGYTAGILLGYSITPKLALETGVYFDLKKYYSSGEYFSSKNVNFLNYVDLLNVDGNCNMIEVPLNLRYNFHSGIKNNWFVSTGLSTYFMFKESYEYNYLYNGNAREKYYSYSKSSQYWLSILNISAGYEHPIGKIGNLRLEPYVRIPFTGMGTGSLPIMSAGLNVGITHRIK